MGGSRPRFYSDFQGFKYHGRVGSASLVLFFPDFHVGISDRDDDVNRVDPNSVQYAALVIVKAGGIGLKYPVIKLEMIR